MGLESQVATLKEDKAKLLEDILEAERQVLMWEKKIALERETQAALDPTVRCMGVGCMGEVHGCRVPATGESALVLVLSAVRVGRGRG